MAKKQLNIRIEENTKLQLEIMSMSLGITYNQLVEKLINDFYEEYHLVKNHERELARKLEEEIRKAAVLQEQLMEGTRK